MYWDKQFEIGVAIIDDQHREWIARVIKLGGAIGKRKSAVEMAAALKYVVAYTQTHFAQEEAYMQKIFYPGLESQKKLHRAFEKYITEVLVDLKIGKAVLPAQLYESMSNWIVQHIKEEDRRIGQFVSRHGNGDRRSTETDPGQDDSFAAKLKELAGLLESELITEVDYSAKKQAMLQKFIMHASKNMQNDSIARLQKLKNYCDEGVLTEDDLQIGKALLARRINVAKELACQVGSRAKMVHLKNLFEKELITVDQFETKKSEILRRI